MSGVVSGDSEIHTVSYDRSRVHAGIVHFGVGNFHRSHQAMYVDRLLSDPATFDAAANWGICGVGVLPTDMRMRDALLSQGCEYTLVERRPDGAAAARRVGAIIEYLYAPEEIETVLEQLADPMIRIVSLTITEGGYNVSDSTGAFDATNTAVLADARPDASPATVFGIIVAGLKRRRERGIEPFTVMSCDNIEGNGHVARRSVVSFAQLVDPELAEWIEVSVRFPSSMVDRITPVTTDADREWVAKEFGADDAWPVIGENFDQWVLEDDFASGRPPLEDAGVQLVSDVRPYELMKLRLLNAGHQTLAFSGLLSGFRYVHEAASDPVIRELTQRYMDAEASPTLDPVPGIDLRAYKLSLLERFTNPSIADTLERLATDTSDRIPKFVIPVIRDLRSSGNRTRIGALIVAAWARYAEVCVQHSLPLRDRQETAVRDAVDRMRAHPSGFLANTDWFGDLSVDKEFVGDFTDAVEALRQTPDPRTAVLRIIRHGQTEPGR
ncbi:mannitol dehydrogenase family protein [Microbacterium sp. X-17]|uniref:mannitol dehydrogenase family protein n=1 Tax=Microbacterium sp. X-17 TaxID=3144404 RepID=UPI0031F4E8DD